MNTVKKNQLSKTILGIIVVLLFATTPGLPLTWENGAGGGSGGDRVASTGELVENLVVEGAIYYLQACSDIQAILKRVEQQAIRTIDYAEIQQLVIEALEQVSSVREIHERLIKAATENPAPFIFIQGLKDFDYPTFMKENRLIEPIFKRVETYLCRGDIPGFLSSVYSELKIIEMNLRIINKYVSTNRMPALSFFWKLNETCATTSLLGSYATRVFYAVK